MKFIALFMGFGFITSCGFSPIYSQNGTSLGKISIEPIDGRIGYFLQNSLNEHLQLEKDNGKNRTLKIELKKVYRNASLRTNSYASRYQIFINASYSLTDARLPNPIKGTASTVVAYDITGSSYSEVTLQADAEERAANDLADKIWADLIVKAR